MARPSIHTPRSHVYRLRFANSYDAFVFLRWNVRRILATRVNAPLPPEANKITKI